VRDPYLFYSASRRIISIAFFSGKNPRGIDVGFGLVFGSAPTAKSQQPKTLIVLLRISVVPP